MKLEAHSPHEKDTSWAEQRDGTGLKHGLCTLLCFGGEGNYFGMLRGLVRASTGDAKIRSIGSTFIAGEAYILAQQRDGTQ